MKHTTSIIKLFSLALFVLVGTACIDNFDKINQKDYQVDKEELGREGYNVGASLTPPSMRRRSVQRNIRYTRPRNPRSWSSMN